MCPLYYKYLLTQQRLSDKTSFIIPDGKNCKTCDRIQSVLETKTVDLNEAGIKVVKINDKKSAKSFGILSSPGLTYFKGGKGDNFEGELTDGEALMDFLASPEAMELPDQIEEVNAKQLDILVQEKQFVAVIFCKYRCRLRWDTGDGINSSFL